MTRGTICKTCDGQGYVVGHDELIGGDDNFLCTACNGSGFLGTNDPITVEEIKEFAEEYDAGMEEDSDYTNGYNAAMKDVIAFINGEIL